MAPDVPFWWRQLCSAVRLNADNEALRALSRYSASNQHAATSTATWLRLHLRYQFDGDAHRILSLREADRRGYGACGDAAAAIAAVLFLRKVELVNIAYEATEALDGYAHVRVHSGRLPVDPWPEASFNVPPRALLTLTPEVVRWPVHVAEPHR